MLAFCLTKEPSVGCCLPPSTLPHPFVFILRRMPLVFDTEIQFWRTFTLWLQPIFRGEESIQVSWHVLAFWTLWSTC